MVFGQDLQEIPADLNFSCDGREYGYYADPATNCQVFHICLGDGDIKWSFLCPNQTIFNQVIISTKNSLHTEFQNPKKCIVLKINSSFFSHFSLQKWSIIALLCLTLSAKIQIIVFHFARKIEKWDFLGDFKPLCYTAL